MNTNKSIQDTLSSVLDEGEYIIDFPVDKIRITPQVRRKYKADKVKEIAASIALHGQLEPCIISEPDEEGMATLFFGFTRYYATVENQLPTLKAVMRSQPKNVLVVQMAENMHRENLDIVDTALGIAELSQTMKPKEICAQLIVGNAWVSKMLAIGKLPLDILDDLPELTNDVETYYLLAQVHKKSPDTAFELINEAKKTGELKRVDVKTAQATIKGGKEPDEEQTDSGSDDGSKAGLDAGSEPSAGTNSVDIPDDTDGGTDGKLPGSDSEEDAEKGGNTGGSSRIPGTKKTHKVVVSFFSKEKGETVEGYLVTNQESVDGFVAVSVEGSDNLIATEELKLVRIVYA